jgi:hypothetical protein
MDEPPPILMLVPIPNEPCLTSEATVEAPEFFNAAILTLRPASFENLLLLRVRSSFFPSFPSS